MWAYTIRNGFPLSVDLNATYIQMYMIDDYKGNYFYNSI